MSYDPEPGQQIVHRDVAPADPEDLEAIVTLLEVGAVMLTDGPDSWFSEADLIDEAQRVGGAQLGVDERDIRIVLPYVKFLERKGGRLRLR